MLIHTAEIRWFFPGESPRDVADWFANGGPRIACEPRTDRYLVMPAAATVGVKVREGRFELKAQRGAAQRVTITDGSAGILDSWVKWIAPSPPRSDWLNERAVVEVLKERTLRGYRLEGSSIRAMDMDSGSEWAACRAELGRVEVRDEAWWSMAFEASGDPVGLEEVLEGVLRGVFSESPPPKPFPIESSCSYPAFLQRWTASVPTSSTD